MKQITAISLMILVTLSTISTVLPGAFAITLGQTYSTTKVLIGIQFEQSCLTLVKANQTTVTYKTLKPLDNTNPNYSGKWVDLTYYHRLLPQVKSAWVQYDQPFLVMVDPDPDFTTLARMITVKCDHFVYINPDDIVTNQTRFEYHDRFVRLPGCDEATVYANFTLINDTVNYLENGCTKTIFNEKVKTTVSKITPFSFNNRYSSLLYDQYRQQLFNGVKQLHNENMPTGGGLGPGNCITKHTPQCNYKDPYSNW